LLVCVAGCGGGHARIRGPKPLTKAAYDRRMTAIGLSMGADIRPVAEARTAHTAELALTKVKDEFAALDTQLAAITPPTPIRADQAHLVAAVGELENELASLIAKLHTGDLKVLNSFDSLKGNLDLAAAVKAISKAGYHIAG